MLERPLYDEWLKRLRSGEWEQGTGALCVLSGDYRGYCCLGVLAEIMHEAGLLQRYEREEGDEVSYEGNLPNADPAVYLSSEIIHYEVQQKLAARNDAGDSFELIADVIESEYAHAILAEVAV